jgi:hypothetical protein
MILVTIMDTFTCDKKEFIVLMKIKGRKLVSPQANGWDATRTTAKILDRLKATCMGKFGWHYIFAEKEFVISGQNFPKDLVASIHYFEVKKMSSSKWSVSFFL